MSDQDLRSEEYRLGNVITQDSDIIDASFEITPASLCSGCGTQYTVRLSPGPCPFLHSFRKAVTASTDGAMIDSASRFSVDIPRAVEESLPSYYEHLSLSLLAPETPEEAPSPRVRRRLQTEALPLPDNMDCIGDFLDGVVAYVEVRSNLGDHSGAIGTLLYRMGASIQVTLSSSVTHAVLCSARPAIVRKAKSLNVLIVAARWVMACKDQLRRVEEEDWPMLPGGDDYKGLRQYRYKVSGVNETPSPMSIRNLALLSRTSRLQSRKEGDSPLSSPGSPRQIWQSPRKSLRRVLFTRPDLLSQPSIPSGIDFEEEEYGEEVSMLSIPETQEITEVAETQNPTVGPPLPVPETDPAMFGQDTDPNGGVESFEVAETQPTNTSDSELVDPDFADPDFADLDLTGLDASAFHSPVSPAQRTSQTYSCRSTTGDWKADGSFDLEESFNSLSVHERSASHQPGSCEVSRQVVKSVLEVSAESMDMVIEDQADSETADDSAAGLLPGSPEENMELTRMLQRLPRKSQSHLVQPEVTMVLTQPAPTDIYSEQLGSFSHELGQSIEVEVNNVDASPPLELILAPGTSQSLSTSSPPSDENTAVFVGGGPRPNARKMSTADSYNAVQNRLNLCSEEIAMSWSSEDHGALIPNTEAAKNCSDPDSASMGFSLSSGAEKRGSCTAIPERRKTVELTPVVLNRCPSSKRTSDVVTPLPNRIQARISGAFSDDNSPCMDARRTIVLTGLKNKRSVLKSLNKLSRSLGQFDVANEVSTRTEAIVIGEYKRTLAVLLGISWGCWFVSVKWVTESIKAGYWLEFDDFEVRDYLAPMVTNRKARTGEIDKSEAEIFRGMKVFVSRRESLQPSADALQRMVLQAGGKVVFDSRQAHVYVGNSKPAKKSSCPCVTTSWIVESVAAGHAQALDAHRL